MREWFLLQIDILNLESIQLNPNLNFLLIYLVPIFFFGLSILSSSMTLTLELDMCTVVRKICIWYPIDNQKIIYNKT